MNVRSLLLGVATLGLVASTASAQAVRNLPGANLLARNDDGSTGLVDIGFTANFYGVSRTQLHVNNNGNVTFDGPLATFTPFELLSTNRQIIAPFFADVDTRNLASAVTNYGTTTVNGRNAFVVNWWDGDFAAKRGVGYFVDGVDKLNIFQLVLIDRSDIGAGDFDFEFNYDQMLWETGDASGGTNGLGGFSARIGFSNGVDTAFELPGSAVNGAFLDGGPAGTRLIGNRLNSDVDGRYVFNVRNGVVSTVPEPSTYALVATGLVALVVVARRRRQA